VIYLEELIDLVIIVKLSITLLKILNPVETYIPDLWRKILLYSSIFNISNKRIRESNTTDIFYKRSQYKLNIVTS
jgi:hypothetical protein